ncbi:TPA: hypothetical protein DGT35_00465 [Patescibacteria group bacterium]|nr:hypothetical protein [Patescibacteria group bacterium]|tara:strand:+ start:6372 stop:7580 length:1209 start_codon:yes stop_codon:yes gene_type:complete
MKFKYSARTKSGELQVGNIESVNKEAALNILNTHDLYVLSIEGVQAPVWYRQFLSFFNRVKSKDLMIFTRQFSVMLEADIPLSDTLKSLYRQTRNQILKEAAFDISSDIDSGLSLSQALEKQSHIFSEFYINLIRSAEVTGQVESAMTFLADYIEKENILVSKIRNALIYPVFVIVLFIITSAVLLGVVFPQLEPIFTDAQVDLPMISQFFLNLGNFIAGWWWALLIGSFVVILILIDYFRGKEGRFVFDQLALGMPIFGKLFRQSYVARFSEATSILIKGGIPIAQAIEIGSHTVDSPIYREALHDVANHVRQGESLSAALEKNEDFFPPLTSQMVAIGEKTGRLEEMLGRIYDFYSREVDDLVNNLVELIQPILILIIGGFVGLLFASILLPIYNLVQVF